MTDASQQPARQEFIITGGGVDDRARAQDALLRAIAERRFDESSRFAVRLAVEEAISNAFKHGNKNDPGKVVRLGFQVDDERIEIAIEDEGHGFDPTSVPDPTQEENLDIPSGRGIVLMRSFMTEVRFEPPGNRVLMIYTRSRAG